MTNTIQSVKKYWHKIKSIQAKAADAVLCSWATQDSLIIIPKYLYSLRCKNNSIEWEPDNTEEQFDELECRPKKGQTKLLIISVISDTAETGW